MLLHAHMHTCTIYMQTTAWQISLICVHVDCTAINNQVNNIHSLPSGPCIQWGGAIAPVCTPLATGLPASWLVYMYYKLCFKGHPSPDGLRSAAKTKRSVTHHIATRSIHVHDRTKMGHHKQPPLPSGQC